MAVIQANTDLYTYSDMVQYVCDAHAVDRTGLNERHARSAVRYAYRDLPARHQWNYYYRQQLLQTVASYSTGTVTFDYTGGTAERQLTLTTGTWPSWAAYGRIVIDNVHYDVATRESGTAITLAETSNPGADITDDTTFEIYRNSYPLPANFGVMDGLWDVSSQFPINFIDQRTQHTALQAFYDNPGQPLHATIRATGKYLGGLEVILGPPPSDLLTYDMLYLAQPRALALDEYSAGSASITAGTASVTGTSTTFPVNCVGSIIRFSAGPTKPSGMLGSLDGTDNPFVHQGVVKTRTSATALVLEEVMPSAVGNLTTVGYTISDPIDVEPYRMLTALQRSAEAEFARLSGRQDASFKMGVARKALLEAMEADTTLDGARGRVIYNPLLRRATVTNDA